jgi:solute carrier family 45, member 1/2/4
MLLTFLSILVRCNVLLFDAIAYEVSVQAGIRAFIVDNAPAHQQESANAWASRVTGVGNILGYVFGYMDLPKYFPFFGDTQFQVLCVLASIALSSTLLISCLYIKERDPRLEGPPASDNPGLFEFFRQVFSAIRRLPPRIRMICEVQFFSWIGWFPFLFYITTYIGQLYVNPHLKPDLSDNDIDRLWEQATRIGTFALLVYAIVSLAGNVLLPFLIVPSYRLPSPDGSNSTITPSSPVGIRHRSSSFGPLPFSGSSANLSVCLPTDNREPVGTSSTLLSRMLARVQIPGLTLRRMWLLSQILFAICMFSTFFLRTPVAATVMAAIVGIPWALTVWAPFALISTEIAQREELGRRRHRGLGQHRTASEGSEIDGFKQDEDGEGPADQAGIILGLHNVAVSTPQILATLISSVVFKMLQKPRGVPGDDSLGWVLRIGGVSALIATFFTSRLGEASEE